MASLRLTPASIRTGHFVDQSNVILGARSPRPAQQAPPGPRSNYSESGVNPRRLSSLSGGALMFGDQLAADALPTLLSAL